MRNETERRKEQGNSAQFILLGQFGIIAAFFALLIAYLQLFRRDLYRSPHTVYLIFSLITLFPLLTYLLFTYKFFSVYIIPSPCCPLCCAFSPTRAPLMAHVMTIFVASLPLHNSYRFLLTQLVAGVVGICCIKDLTERSQIFLPPRSS